MADPTLCTLLRSLAESDPPDLSVLPVLTDWLEERKDERAEQVRALMPPATDGALKVDIARSILALFPEGPRWRCQSVTRRDGENGLLISLVEPYRNNFLTVTDAREAANSPWAGVSLPVVGPFWPDHSPQAK